MIITTNEKARQARQSARKERRPEKITLDKAKRKLKRKLKDSDLPVEFNNQTTTAFGNFSLVETFKRLIGLSDIIQKNLNVNKHHNSKYNAELLLDYMIDAIVLGKTRFEHIGELTNDPGYKKLKGIERFPSEGRFRDLMSRMSSERVLELTEINRRIIELKSRHEGPKEVWFDYDDTVITLFGDQTGGEVGYNPRYHGRPSYKAKVCFVAGTEELIHLELYSGNAHSNTSFLEFHRVCSESLPNNYVLKGVRADKGFIDEDNVERFEAECLDYVVKMKMTNRLRTQILALPSDSWKDLDDKISVATMEYLPTGWKFSRKVAVIREKSVKATGQLYLPVKECFKYQAIMTNLEEESEAVWRFYNKRGQVENKIDELKDGFGVDETSQHVMEKNRAFALIKSISYNLINWFKSATMPGSKFEIATLRRRVLAVPGNLVGNGWYRKVNLAPNTWLEKTVGWIKSNMCRFFDFVANGFKPLTY